MNKKFEPLEDRILVKEIKPNESEISQGGLILDTIKKPTKNGIVISVGTGTYAKETGIFMPNVLHEGDEIIFGEAIGMEIYVNGENLLLMREGDILMAASKKTKGE